MSNREHHNPTSGNTSAGEQIPHSGVGGYEQPVNDFDNTSLQDAVDQGLLETPESPAPLVAPQTTETEPSRRRLSVKEKAGLALAALGLGVGGTYLATQGGDSNEHTPDRPVASATPNVDTTETVEPTPEVIPTPEIQGVSVEQHPDPADAAKELEILRLKIISGDVPSYNDFYKADNTLTYDEYLDKLMFALYGSTDRSDPNIKQTLDLKQFYDATNEELMNFFGDDVHYRIELVDMRVQNVNKNTVTSKPLYKVNTEEIPADYRVPAIDAAAEDHGTTVQDTLKSKDGLWIIDTAHTTH